MAGNQATRKSRKQFHGLLVGTGLTANPVMRSRFVRSNAIYTNPEAYREAIHGSMTQGDGRRPRAKPDPFLPLVPPRRFVRSHSVYSNPRAYRDVPRVGKKNNGGGHGRPPPTPPPSTALQVIFGSRIVRPAEMFCGLLDGRTRRSKIIAAAAVVRIGQSRVLRGPFPEPPRGKTSRRPVPNQGLTDLPMVASRQVHPPEFPVLALLGGTRRGRTPSPTDPFLLRGSRVARGVPPSPESGRTSRRPVPNQGLTAESGTILSRKVVPSLPPAMILSGRIIRHGLFFTGESATTPLPCDVPLVRPGESDDCRSRPETETSSTSRPEESVYTPGRPSRCANET